MRLALYDIVDTEKLGGEDILENPIGVWDDFGVVGWDDGLQTYFLQLENIWWFGRSYNEIKSPFQLLFVIRTLFNDFNIQFLEKGLLKLVVARDDDCVDIDTFWNQNPGDYNFEECLGSIYTSNEYLNACMVSE